MKNKWLKTLTCFVSVFAIGSTIAISSTSCGCSAVEKINPLPENVYDIDETTHELKGFKSDFLNNQDSEIYQDNFKDCDAMRIPADVTSIGYSAFANTDSYPTQTLIPEFITKLTFAENSNCSSIGDWAFCKAASLSFIKIPSSLTTIEFAAFYSCSALTSVDLSKTNMSTIGDGAFYSCTSLTSVTFPTSLESIGDWAFFACKFTSVTFPSSLVSFGDGCFGENALLTLDFSKCAELSIIGENAFCNCTALNSIIFPNNLSSIDAGAFQYCSSLTSVNLSNCSNLTTIGNSAFTGCSTLTSIIFPSSLTTVGQLAFCGCPALASVTLPNNLSSISNWVFYECTGLKTIKFPNSLTAIGEGVFFKCSSLTSVTFPSSLESIGGSAFYECSKLNNIKWNLHDEYLTEISIGTNAFKDISSTGKVKSLNLSIASSQQLLEWIRTKGSFPSGDGWEPAK